MGIATTITDRVLAHPGVLETFEFIASGGDSAAAKGSPRRARMGDAFAGFRDLMTGIPEIDPIHDGDRLGD